MSSEVRALADLRSQWYVQYSTDIPAHRRMVCVASVFSRVSLIVVDAIVVGVTVAKTLQHTREATRLGLRASVGATLLRDGTSP